jgi:hypothetical protein
MAIILESDGVRYPSGLLQTKSRCIIKHRVCSATTVNQGLQSGTWDFITGAEIDMGVPTKSNNWYRVEYYSCGDDWGSTNGGWGYAVYRNTPSSGWVRLFDQGWHAQYDNNAGDFYTTGTGLFFVSVHPSFPNEPHSFRLYGRRHPDVAFRVNSSIGADLRQAGWVNNLFEVYELDGDVAVSQNINRV